MEFALGVVLFALGIGVSIALHEAGHMYPRLVYYDLRDGEIRALAKGGARIRTQPRCAAVTGHAPIPGGLAP